MMLQRILADPTRGDGHDTTGTPGDCLRVAVANLLRLPYDDVPHFAQHVSWWDTLRRWARNRGGDFSGVTPENGSVRHCFATPPENLLLLGCGPSPRGPFWHTVLVDLDLRLIHDPHPSGAGLLEVAEGIVHCQAWDPPPAAPLMLTAGAPNHERRA
jgi:hypothetical protein